MSSSHPRLAILGLLIVTLVAACSSGGTSFSTPVGASALTSASAAPSSGPSATLTKLKVGLGYIPSVQFAQFYLALQAGYYAQAGLDVELQNKIDQDLIPLV